MKKPTGDMYEFIDAIWNPVSGRCSHGCSYCYVSRIMKRFRQKIEPIHINEVELKCNLGKGKTIFVCSGCDLFAEDVPYEFIAAVINRTLLFPDNKYLFQTKYPVRFNPRLFGLSTEIHKICATIETNRYSRKIMGYTPPLIQRALSLKYLREEGFETMVTVEPIMDFDLEEMLELISMTGAVQVNIGADTGNNHLPEPSKEKIMSLILELEKFSNVVQKNNLRRLMV